MTDPQATEKLIQPPDLHERMTALLSVKSPGFQRDGEGRRT